MASVNEVILDRFIGHHVNLSRIEADLQLKAAGVLSSLQEELVSKMSTADPTAVLRSDYRQRRLEALIAQIDTIIKSAYSGMNKMMVGELIDLAEFEGLSTGRIINGAIGVEVMSVALPPALLREIARDTLIEGAPSREWWGRQSAATRQAFSDELRKGVAAGEPLGSLVQRVRGTATGRSTSVIINGRSRRIMEFKGGILDIQTRKAEALVRTSVQAVSNNARNQILKDNQDLVKGQKPAVTFDSRTSLICISRSESAWDMEGNPIPPTTETFPGIPPWHFQCRTVMIPILRSFNELKRSGPGSKVKLNDWPESTKASMDGQIPKGRTYEQWLKGKPVKFQKEVLGATRHRLWSEGKINFRELISSRGTPVPVSTLLDLEKRGKIQ